MPNLITEINNYYSNPTSEKVAILARRGAIVIDVMLEVIVERLHDATRTTLSPAFMVYQELGDKLIVKEGVQCISLLEDIIKYMGQEGFEQLLLLLQHENLDVRKLVALALCSHNLAKPLAKTPLLNAFSNTKDTGLKLALAAALAMQDPAETAPIRTLAVPFLTDPDNLSYLQAIVQNMPSKTVYAEVEIGDLVYQHLATNNAPWLVILEIATEGLAINNKSGLWIRVKPSQHFPGKDEDWEMNRAFPILKYLFPFQAANLEQFTMINSNRQELIEDLQYLLDQNQIEAQDSTEIISNEPNYVLTYQARNYWRSWWKEIPEEDLNLDDLARDYLGAPRAYCSEQKEVIIQQGEVMVFPLLHAALNDFADTADKYYREFRAEPGNAFAAKTFGKPIVTELYKIISAIGQPGWDIVCRALQEDTKGMMLLAGLLLFEDAIPSKRTVNSINNVIEFMQLEHPRTHKSHNLSDFELIYILMPFVIVKVETDKTQLLINMSESVGITSEDVQTMALVRLFESFLE